MFDGKGNSLLPLLPSLSSSVPPPPLPSFLPLFFHSQTTHCSSFRDPSMAPRCSLLSNIKGTVSIGGYLSMSVLPVIDIQGSNITSFLHSSCQRSCSSQKVCDWKVSVFISRVLPLCFHGFDERLPSGAEMRSNCLTHKKTYLVK